MAQRTAPGELELLRAFVNTNELDGADDLISPRVMADWLAQRGLLAPGSELSEGDHRRALVLREALRELAAANAGERPDKRAVEILNEAGERAALLVRAESSGARLFPAGEGIDAAIGRFLAIYYTAVVNGTWTRLKACARDSCRWLFYDHSKNRSSRWCSMAVCGNRVKAITYRARHGGHPAGVESRTDLTSSEG